MLSSVQDSCCSGHRKAPGGGIIGRVTSWKDVWSVCLSCRSWWQVHRQFLVFCSSSLSLDVPQNPPQMTCWQPPLPAQVNIYLFPAHHWIRPGCQRLCACTWRLRSLVPILVSEMVTLMVFPIHKIIGNLNRALCIKYHAKYFK